MANIRVTHGKVQVLVGQDRDTDTPIRVTHGEAQVLTASSRSENGPIRVTHGKVQVLVPGEPTKKLLVYTELGVGDTMCTQLSAWLTTHGYDLAIRDDATLLTDTDWADFAAVGGVRLTVGLGDDLRSKAEAAGVPYFMHMTYAGIPAGTGKTVPSTEALLTGTVEAAANQTDWTVQIVDDSHVITEVFTELEKFQFTSGFQYRHALDDGADHAGQALVQADPAIAAWVAGQYDLIVLSPGTDDLDTPPVAVTQRSMIWGMSYGLISSLTTDGDILLSRAFAWLVGDLVAPPAQPTITPTVDSQTQVTLDGTPYLSGQGGPHLASQWQVALVADTTFSNPVFDSGQDIYFLESREVYNLDADVQYICRVRYLEDADPDDVWSAWSVTQSFTMDAAPDTPTISHLSSAADRAAFEGTAFNSSDGDRTHAASEWQLTLAADTGFATPLQTQLVTFGDLLTFNFSGLDLWANQYIARVRYADDKGGWSAWSAASSATGIIADGQFYTAFAERPVGIDIVDDVLADWDELVDGDESVWPIEIKTDAVCEVVSHRTSEAGVPETVDPAFWQGFQQVDKQIVWARLQFEYEGGGDYPCGSGVRSDSGLICRTNLGLLETADIENDIWERQTAGGPTTWQVVQGVGPNGEPSRRVAYTMPLLPDQWPCGYIGPFQMPPSDFPVGFLAWRTGGVRPAGEWAQILARADSIHCPDMVTLNGWGGIMFVQRDDPPYEEFMGGLTPRPCMLYLNWFQNRIMKYNYGQQLTWTDYGVQGPFEWPVHRGQWNYQKAHWSPELYHYSYAAGDRGGSGKILEMPTEPGSPHAWTDGRVGFVVDRCNQYHGSDTVIDFVDLRICSGNTVVFTNLPNNWRLHITSDTHSSNTWLEGTEGGDDVVFDFSNDAWPADSIELWNPGGNLIEKWYVPDGIWGGDTYNINAGGLGVGPIGGAAVRLGP